MLNLHLLLRSLKDRARQLRTETYALYLAARHPRVSKLAKLVIGITVAYALSPIDLIPDFIPVLGYLDDLVLVPLGIALAVKLTDPEILRACRLQAETVFAGYKPVSKAGAAAVIIIWLACAFWFYTIISKMIT